MSSEHFPVRSAFHKRKLKARFWRRHRWKAWGGQIRTGTKHEPFEAEACLNNVYKRKRVSVINRKSMLFREMIVIYSDNGMKPINTLCGQNAELPNIKASNYSGFWTYETRVTRGVTKLDQSVSYKLIKRQHFSELKRFALIQKAPVWPSHEAWTSTEVSVFSVGLRPNKDKTVTWSGPRPLCPQLRYIQSHTSITMIIKVIS
jgi:hypothetical protein